MNRRRMPLGVILPYLLLVLTAGGIGRTEAAPAFLAMWGSFGSGPGQMKWPHGAACSADGFLYVSDQYNYRIVKFTTAGALVTSWGTYGPEPGQFLLPIGLDVDAAGNVYVVDYAAPRIQVFTGAGDFVRQWETVGNAAGDLRRPRDVAIDASGYVHVADESHGAIQVFTQDGTFLGTWGDLLLRAPSSIAFDLAGDAYIAEGYGPPSVSKWVPFGARLGSWPADDGPTGVAVDRRGNAYLAEHGNHWIRQFTTDGVFLSTWGTFGTGAGQFNEPADVCVDPDGNVYVVDMHNHRIQEFGDSPVPVSRTTWGGIKAAYRR